MRSHAAALASRLRQKESQCAALLQQVDNMIGKWPTGGAARGDPGSGGEAAPCTVMTAKHGIMKASSAPSSADMSFQVSEKAVVERQSGTQSCTRLERGDSAAVLSSCGLGHTSSIGDSQKCWQG